MKIKVAKRIEALKGYAFAELQNRVAELKAAGHEVIDFGVGDPTAPTPKLIREACKKGVDDHATSGYPAYQGSKAYRSCAAAWIKRRFGVELHPESEVTSTIGSKEAVFHFHEAVVDPGDVVLCPSPGYPPYVRGTLLAEGEPYQVPQWERSDFLPDLDSVPDAVARKAKLLWLCHPHAPSGRVLSRDELGKIAQWAQSRQIIVASDEAYIDFAFDGERAASMLEVSRKGIIAFFSLSKRSAMTGYRVGFAAGDEQLVGALRSVKTNLDSGTPWFVEEAAMAALGDESHVDEMRAFYKSNRDMMCEALVSAGLKDCTPKGTIYIWQRTPDGMSSVDFAKALLSPPHPVVVTPGPWLAEPLADGTNPGEGFVRFALCPGADMVERAARKISTLAF